MIHDTMTESLCDAAWVRILGTAPHQEGILGYGDLLQRVKGERIVSVTLLDEGDGCRLIFEGRMTFEFSRDLEDQIIDALRRFTRFKLDLSGIQEIDLCGLHLLQIIHSFCGDTVEVIAGSPLVERTSRQLLAPKHAISLRGSPHEGTRRGREKHGEPVPYHQMSH